MAPFTCYERWDGESMKGSESLLLTLLGLFLLERWLHVLAEHLPELMSCTGKVRYHVN